MNSLIAKAQRCQVHIHGRRILKIAGNVLRGSAANSYCEAVLWCRAPSRKLLTAKLTLDWLKETDIATRLESGIGRVIAEGNVRNYDMGGKNSTLEVAQAIADYAI